MAVIYRNPKGIIDHGNYPVLLLDITVDDEKITARIPYAQKALEYGYVFLGPEFEELMPALELPIDEAQSRPWPMQLRGFTDDPQVVAWYRQFKAAVDAGNFTPGPIED